MCLRLTATVFLLLPNLPGAQGDDPSPTMTKMVMRETGPDIPRDSFAAKPKTFYRVGAKLGRVEESLNPDTGLQLHVIVKHPDVWMVNLADKTGRHVKDPDTNGVFRLPIVTLPGATDLNDLRKGPEMGHEVEYFKANGGKESGREKLDGTDCIKQELSVGEARVELWTTAAKGVPLQVRVTHKGNVIRVLRYETYATGLKPDTSLFKLPTGIKIVGVGGE
jgi:hypothetical protein